MTPARLLCFVLPALVVAAVLSPLPGTDDLCWRAEILGGAMVVGIVALLNYADQLADGNVGGEERDECFSG